MSGWHKATEQLPNDKDECLLLIEGEWGDKTYGPITWTKSSPNEDGCWIDLFATPEAGAIIKPDQVDMWRLWDEIKPKEEE